MGGLGHMIQQPGGHMAQLMTQRALQLLRVVQHLCAQLHPGCVPVDQTTASDSANIQAESRQCTLCSAAALDCATPLCHSSCIPVTQT